MRHRGLLKRLDQAWAAFQQSYAGLSDVELVEPGVTGAWSVRDIIAHVTWWEEEALTHLPLILAGGKPPRYSVTHGGIDSSNARMTEQRKHLSSGETRVRRRLLLDTYGHYPKHARAIRTWRESRCGPGEAAPR